MKPKHYLIARNTKQPEVDSGSMPSYFMIIHLEMTVLKIKAQVESSKSKHILQFWNKLRRRRTAYENVHQKFEVFSRFDDMSTTDIINCANRLIDSYPEIDTEFPDELVQSVHFLSTRSMLYATVACQPSVVCTWT